MILPQSRWEQVLNWFTDEEKLAIHQAQTGMPALQKGIVIDETKLTPELRGKLLFHFGSKKTRAGAAWRGAS